MATMHRPDVHWLTQRFCKECRYHEQVLSQKKHFYMWPRLNLEDLSKTEPLLLLINSRGRCPPSTFALVDLEPTWFGTKHDAIPLPPFLDQHIMVFSGRDCAETYGELISWAEDPRAFVRLYTGREVSPGEGLWVLEIQDRLYQFLVNACKHVLHDISVDDHDGLLALPIQPEPPLPTANRSDNGSGTSLLTTRYEAMYHIPARLDIRRMQNLVASKLAEAEDTLWALREDPGFFATALLERYQCQPEHLLDTKGKPHRLLRDEAGRSMLMSVAVNECWHYYLPAVEVWGTLHDQIARLAELKETLFDNPEVKVEPDDELPPELAMAFYTVLFHLYKMVQPAVCNIFQEARMSPPTQHMFRRRPGGDLESDLIALRKPPGLCRDIVHSGAMPSKELNDYMGILHDMLNPAFRLDLGLHNLIEDMETITRDPASRSLIWPTVAATLSDVAIVSECTRQIELFQPWAATFRSVMKNQDIMGKIFAEWEQTLGKLPIMEHRLTWETCELAVKLPHARYPVEKRPSRANVEAMRAAEAALDRFWEAALGEMRQQEVLTARIEKVLEGAKPERTPAWIEPPKVEKAGPQADDHCSSVASSFGGLFIDAQKDSCSMRPAAPKAKIKTRGVARAPPPEPAETERRRLATSASESTASPSSSSSPTDVTPPEEKLKVDRRALAVFETLFHRPSPGAQPGEVAWAEFTHAMHRVGFGVEKLGGSAWQFTPGAALALALTRGSGGRGGGAAAAGCARGIQFHEPHPVAKIPFRTARRYGRRLARTYGWCAEVFELREA